MGYGERELDQFSSRRRCLDKERKKEFDAHYRSPLRRRTQAGKGDLTRPVNNELYDAGWAASFGATEDIRLAARRRWEDLMKRKLNE